MRQIGEPPAVPSEQAAVEEVRLFPADHLYLLGVVAAIAIGIGIRAAHLFATNFPLNDGGLFYEMARNLQSDAFKLPETTSYNFADLPFTYPPLGLYLAALLDKLTPFSLVDLFRLLPLLFTSLSIVAFYLLAKRILPSRVAVVAATFAFALVPRSFIWLLMGGGVTRGLGLLMAILALHEMHRTFTTFRMRYAFSAAVFSGLTILSHLETGWFLAFSIAIFFLWFGKERHSVTSSVVVGGSTLLVIAPWMLAVLSAHGTGPFFSANSSGGSVFSGGSVTEYALTSLVRVISTSEPYFPLIGMLGVVGLLSAIKHRLIALPVWWAATILLDVRAFPTFTTIPIAMLAGMAVSDVVIPMLDRGREQWPQLALVRGSNGDTTAPHAQFVAWPGWTTVAVLAALVLYALVGAMLRKPGLGGEGEYLVSLTSGQRVAMHWVDVRTPPDSSFLVVPRSAWQVDKESEWFPVLANRPSVATVQGTEWLPDHGFDDAVSAYDRAWDCGYHTSRCLGLWAESTGKSFDYVYLTRNDRGQCCGTLLESLERDSDYQKVYDGPGGTVFKVVGILPKSADPQTDDSNS
ncbi:MAG: glycosyltransferase family 39 protein [Dehalococcoidia bacterium]